MHQVLLQSRQELYGDNWNDTEGLRRRILRWSSEKIAWCRETKTTAFLVKRWLASSPRKRVSAFIEPCAAIFGEAQDFTASPASVQSQRSQSLPATFGCSQNWKWRSKESGSTTLRRFRVMRRASWSPFQNLRSRTALRCGSTAGSVWFNQIRTTSKDATVRLTKNSTNAEIWTQFGYFSDKLRIYMYILFFFFNHRKP